MIKEVSKGKHMLKIDVFSLQMKWWAQNGDKITVTSPKGVCSAGPALAHGLNLGAFCLLSFG